MAFSFALGGSIYRTRWLYHPHRWLNLFAILNQDLSGFMTFASDILEKEKERMQAFENMKKEQIDFQER